MDEQQSPPLTFQEAFEKYFGKVTELNKKPYPYPCICGKFSIMSLEQGWVDHIREYHKERVRTPKQIEAVERRRREKAEKLKNVQQIVG